MATLYKHDGTEEEIDISDFKNVQEILGYVELLHPRTMPDHYMLVNEDGKRLRLPYNRKASKIYGMEPHDRIVGNAIVCRKEEFS